MGKNKEFTQVLLKKPNKNVFDLSHDVKLSCNMGELVPVMVEEVIPGDNWKISCEAMVRFAPMLAPVMHTINMFIHYFFVPNRILWDGWEDFITNTAVGGPPAAVPAFPTLNFGPAPAEYDPNALRLADYMGIPSVDNGDQTTPRAINAFPFAAYQKIYSEYYRDQNLVDDDPLAYELADGAMSGRTEMVRLRNRAWEHDYFTSCLPFAQKGDGVDIPLGSVELDPDWMAGNNYPNAGGVPPAFYEYGGTLATGTLMSQIPQFAPPYSGQTGIDIAGNDTANAYDPAGTLIVGSTTINDLRRAFALQRWMEKNARGGTRYIEHILAHFGVHSSDKRLQRPEYITGTMQRVIISEVLQTSETTTGTGGSPQGDMSGHGIAVANGYGGSYFAEEHGFIIGILSVMPKTAYQQGLRRHWLKTTDFTDYFYSDFAHIGEQAVFNEELYAWVANGDGTFGYIPRYSEYKYAPNRTAGDFKTSLVFWTMTRIFASQPQLDDEFITSDPTTRIFAVDTPDIQHLWCHIYNKLTAIRPIPKFSIPGGL